MHRRRLGSTAVLLVTLLLVVPVTTPAADQTEKEAFDAGVEAYCTATRWSPWR